MITLILVVVALICAVLALAGAPRFNWAALGLLFLSGAMLLPHLGTT